MADRARTAELTGLHYKKANHSTVSQEAYVYDDAGNLTQKTVDSVTTDYTYDDIDQMLSEVKSGYSASYTYDGNGNRATRTLNGTTQNYTYDDADKLTEIKVGGTTVKSFGYDAAGRTTGITYSGATTTLAYDYEGRVTSITGSGSTTNSFTYNGLNARMTRSDSNGSRTMLRDGADVLAPVVGGPVRRGLRLPLRGLGGGFSPRAAPSPLPLSLGGRGVKGMEYAPGLY